MLPLLPLLPLRQALELARQLVPLGRRRRLRCRRASPLGLVPARVVPVVPRLVPPLLRLPALHHLPKTPRFKRWLKSTEHRRLTTCPSCLTW